DALGRPPGQDPLRQLPRDRRGRTHRRPGPRLLRGPSVRRLHDRLRPPLLEPLRLPSHRRLVRPSAALPASQEKAMRRPAATLLSVLALAASAASGCGGAPAPAASAGPIGPPESSWVMGEPPLSS